MQFRSLNYSCTENFLFLNEKKGKILRALKTSFSCTRHCVQALNGVLEERGEALLALRYV